MKCESNGVGDTQPWDLHTAVTIFTLSHLFTDTAPSFPVSLNLALPPLSLSPCLSPPPQRWYRGHSDYVRGLAWVEDGTSSSLITGSWDKTVQVWDKSAAAAAEVEAQPTP